MTTFVLVLDTAVKCALVGVLAWAGTRRAGLADARAAHRFWLVAAAAFVLLPLLSWRLPPAAALVPSTAIASRLPAIGSTAVAYAATAYAVVAGLLLARIAAGLAGVARLSKRAIPLAGSDDLVAARLIAMCAAAGATLVESAEVAAPSTAGVLERMVILPDGWRELDAAAIEAAVGHELSHVARRDYLTAIAVEIVCAVWWWHPTAWLARRNVRWFAELACDAAATGTAGPDEYARALVAFARVRAAAAPRLVLSSASELRRRVDLLLAAPPARGRSLRLAAACAFVALPLLLTVRVAPRSPVAAVATGGHASAHAARHAAHQHPH